MPTADALGFTLPHGNLTCQSGSRSARAVRSAALSFPIACPNTDSSTHDATDVPHPRARQIAADTAYIDPLAENLKPNSAR